MGNATKGRSVFGLSPDQESLFAGIPPPLTSPPPPMPTPTPIPPIPLPNPGIGSSVGGGLISGMIDDSTGLPGGRRLPSPGITNPGITNPVNQMNPTNPMNQYEGGIGGVSPQKPAAPGMMSEEEWKDKYRQEASKRAASPGGGIISDIVAAPTPVTTPVAPTPVTPKPVAPKPAPKKGVETDPYERWKQLGRPGGSFENWKKGQ